jgi:isocitrate/isopropylmalate dehydrogenase
MTNKSKNYQIACIPADGIGPEVISAAVDVLKVLTDTLKTFSLEFTDLTWGSDHYKKHGRYIPEGGVESLKQTMLSFSVPLEHQVHIRCPLLPSTCF